MLALWRRAFDLVVRCPLLMLPVMVCEVLGYGVQTGQEMLRHRVIWWLAEHIGSQSELAGGTHGFVLSDMQFRVAVYAFGIPVQWGANYGSVCLYVLAFLVTVALTEQILHNEDVNFAAALSFELRHIRRTLVLGAKVFGICMAAAVLIEIPGILLMERLSWTPVETGLVTGVGFEFVFLATVVWFLAKTTLRLTGTVETDAGTLQRARRVGLLFAVVESVATFIYGGGALRLLLWAARWAGITQA